MRRRSATRGPQHLARGPDEDLDVTAPVTDDTILDDFRQPAVEEDEEDDSEPLPSFKHSEVASWLTNIQAFLVQEADMDPEFIEYIAKIQDKVRQHGEQKKTQRLISNYFMPRN